MKVLARVERGEMTLSEAAEACGLSPRQWRRIAARWREAGDEALARRLSVRPGHKVIVERRLDGRLKFRRGRDYLDVRSLGPAGRAKQHEEPVGETAGEDKRAGEASEQDERTAEAAAEPGTEQRGSSLGTSPHELPRSGSCAAENPPPTTLANRTFLMWKLPEISFVG